MRRETLEEADSPTVKGRLTPEILVGTPWVLAKWDLDEPAPADPQIILQYAKGRFSGLGGCNNFFGPVSEGDEPGDLIVGQLGSTKRVCGEPLDGIEKNFIGNLQRVNRFGFLFGRLALTYQTDGGVGVMVFRKMER